MSYSKKNHKYLRKYKNSNGNWTYVYTTRPLKSHITSRSYYPYRSRNLTPSSIANMITGKEYKEDAKAAEKLAEINDKYHASSDLTTALYSQERSSHWRSVGFRAMRLYKEATVAGVLGKVKNKVKFTALKAQRKVSKILKKLSKK